MKKIILTVAALGAGAGLIVSPVAQAGDKHDKKDKAEWFAEADTSGDGSLDLAEFTAAKGDKMEVDEVKEKFSKCDADGDQKVTLEEMKAKHDKKHDEKHDEKHEDKEE